MWYVTGRKIRYKRSCRCTEQVRDAGRRKKKPFPFKKIKKYSRGLSRQLTELSHTPNINKFNEQNVYYIDLFSNIKLFTVSK